MSNGAPTATSDVKEIRIYSHSTLLYWWPVWVVGFICGIISLMSPYRHVVIPGKYLDQKSEVVKGQTVKYWEINVPKDHDHFDPHPLRGSANKTLGVVFCITLLVVIFITNVSLRGLWSLIFISIIFFLSIIFALLDWWTPILDALDVLYIRINAAGYFLISSVLFVLWLVIVFVFDRQIYMVFTPGQFRVRLEIGDAETAYDTVGIRVQKQRTDLFRHWILGLGSGDLQVQTSGAQAHHFDMPNVSFIGNKVKQIEKLLFTKVVVATSETKPTT
jgi:hypothetical protein